MTTFFDLRAGNWWEIRDHDDHFTLTVKEDFMMIERRQFFHTMLHIPHGNNVSWIEKIGPLPKGMCYDLDCDNFFNRHGVFNFDSWKKDDEALKPWFECKSFCSRSIHRCGYSLFSEVLADGLELWLDGKIPSETDGKIEPSFISSLGSITIG